MDKRIVVVIDAWPPTSHYPLGHYTKTLGVVGDRITETDVGFSFSNTHLPRVMSACTAGVTD